MLKRAFAFAILFVSVIFSPGCGGGGGTTGSSGGGGSGNHGDVRDYSDKWFAAELICMTHTKNDDHHFKVKFKTGIYQTNNTTFGWGNTSAHNMANGQVVQPRAFYGKFSDIGSDVDRAYFDIHFLEPPEVVAGSGTHDITSLSCSTVATKPYMPRSPTFPIEKVFLKGREGYKDGTEIVCDYELRDLKPTEAPWGS